MNLLSHERRKSTKYFVASGAEVIRCEQDDNLSVMEGEEVRIYWSLKTFREEVKFEESREEDKNTSNKDDTEETKFEKSEINERRELRNQEPVVALRGKVSVGGADRVNTESSAVKGQSDEDVRKRDMREMRRTESSK